MPTAWLPWPGNTKARPLFVSPIISPVAISLGGLPPFSGGEMRPGAPDVKARGAVGAETAPVSTGREKGNSPRSECGPAKRRSA
ncbi:hypothetical protein GCM10017083_22250 [Thalassobaculum fulvum]|uniref:Uncharacterized protein n=1 Tax=Thalassobaculum fulvum TaxID=1633335 RepID=A0A919CPY1_9PROT|nr:hypothetical protein GCM10017083_22250 [Thalassobaculum fulvum]